MSTRKLNQLVADERATARFRHEQAYEEGFEDTELSNVLRKDAEEHERFAADVEDFAEAYSLYRMFWTMLPFYVMILWLMALAYDIVY